MKFQIRFLVALCIFLFSGYGQLSAHTHTESTRVIYSTLSNLGKIPFTSFKGAQNDISNYASCYIEKQNDKTYTTDNETEENELTSSKKWLELNNYFITVFSAQTSKHFCQNIKKSSHFCRLFSFLPPCKWYIMFRVIRI